MNEGIKGPIWAAIMSAILPGTGQLVHQRWIKGIAFMIPVLFLSAMLRRKVIMAGGTLFGLFPATLETVLAQLILLGVAAWSAADAYRTALSER